MRKKTNYRTEEKATFNYDLWGPSDSKKTPSEPTKRTAPLPETSVRAVELPHPGMSYNPALDDHQDLLRKATKIEQAKLAKEAKIERIYRKGLPERVPTEEEKWMTEAQGLFETETDTTTAPEADGDGEFYQPRAFGLKTRKKRRKERLARQESRERMEAKKSKASAAEVFRVRSHLKEIKKIEKQQETLRTKKKQRKAKIDLVRPRNMSRHRFQQSDLPLLMSDEVRGQLKDLTPQGSLLEERFKSLQKRNIIETRVKATQVKNKVRMYVKRDHRLWLEAKDKEMFAT